MSLINLGISQTEYTEEEIRSVMSAIDPFYCMGNGVPYLISFSLDRFLYIGENFEDVIGMPAKEAMNGPLSGFISRVFVQEQGLIAMGIFRRSMEVLMEKYRDRYDIQLNIQVGFYHTGMKQRRTLLMQRQPLKWDPHSGLDLLGGTFQDITHLKQEGPPVATITCGGQLLELFEPDPDQPSLELAGFSRKELEVIRLADQGRSIDEVAETTGVSKATVYSHRRNIIAKSGLPNMQKVIEILKTKGIL